MNFIGTTIVLGTVLLAGGTPAAAAGDQQPAAHAPAAGAPGDAAAGADAVVARVNGVAISRGEFDRNWEYLLQRSGIPGDHAGKAGKLGDLRRQVIDRLVDEELLYQEAKRRKLEAPGAAVDAAVAKAHEQFPDPEAFAAALAQNRLSEPGLRAVFARNLSIERLVAEEIGKGVAVSDAEVHDFYSGNQASFAFPEQVRARHILIEVEPEADGTTREAARARAEKLLAALKGGADFAATAKSESDCPSAEQGGDLGFFGRGQMVPEFDEAVFALQPGGLSGVVETRFGFHVIRLEERKAAGTVSEQEAASQIRQYLTAQKTEAAVEERLKGLRSGAAVELLLEF